MSEYDDTTVSADGAYSSKKLYLGKLKGNASKSFELRLWLDENTPLAEGQDKAFSSKIVVINTDEKQLLATYIKELSESDTTNLVADDETEDHNIRYIGADPDNYLCFDEDCSNGKWRVIGLMNNMQTESNGTQSLVKIIRADRVGASVWDKVYNQDISFTNTYGYNDWTISVLKVKLNSGEYYETYIKSYDSLFETVTWKLGGSTYDSTVSKFYTDERGTTVYSNSVITRATEWIGKIGLMYPSDYGYATSGGSTTDRATCLSIATNLLYWGNSSYSDCKNNDYLYDSSSQQWTLTPYSSYSIYVFDVGDSGIVYDFASSTRSVRPVGYLILDAFISSGEGTNEEPWIIGL